MQIIRLEWHSVLLIVPVYPHLQAAVERVNEDPGSVPLFPAQ